MARVNVYLPDDLADRAREAGLNVSGLTQEAVRSALSANQIGDWLRNVAELPPTDLGHDAVMSALAEAKDEIEGIA